MNRKAGSLTTLIVSALALSALFLVAGAGAMEISETENPTTAECQPGQPYNQNCPTIVTFDFPQKSFLTDGKAKLVHLGCNNSCNHVTYTAKHGNKVAAKGTRWFKANYLPNLYTAVTPYAKKQLRQHKKLVVNARVCVHPPGPQNYCKSHKVVLRIR